MLKLKIMSPEKMVLETVCNSVTLPAADGQITVYAKHAPIYTLIKYGEVVAHTDKGNIELAVGAGYAEINGEQVVVLTNYGVLGDDIDAARAESARERASALIAERKSDTDMALAQAELARSMVELKLYSKRKGSN